MPDETRTRGVAVIGSGVAGLTAAYVASHDGAAVTLLEADDRLGGHADTHVVRDGDRELAIDTGFIVHNDRTYPTLLRLFDELGVRTRACQMSMSTRSDADGLEWAGARGLRGLFPSARQLANPRYLRMLTEVPRFHRMARRVLSDAYPRSGGERQETFGAFLTRGGFTPYFRRHFAQPLVAAVWSCDPAVALDYPACYLFAFLNQHGMLQVFGSPQWRTVVGGSRRYVQRVAAGLDEVRTATKVVSVLDTGDGVAVTDGNGTVDRFDAAVLAVHPDQALSLLAEPTPAQREILGAFEYSDNPALLHTDTALLPRSPRAHASWNHRERPDHPGVTISYDLTRLMRLPTQTRYLVTLGGHDLVDPAAVIDRMAYAHPIYTPAAVAAQARSAKLHSDRLALAGAWLGWGFHEDGARSGLAAAERLGFRWERDLGRRQPRAAEPRTGVYRTTITHQRRTPARYGFRDRSHTWLVDLDDLPDHGILGRFEARDHLGDPGRSIRDNLERFLAGHGVRIDGARVLMAAHARALGYCFNPITVFWCLGDDNRPLATVVEVHNTYGDRHAYLAHPDAHGRARVDKQMYVSPFHGTGGHYELVVPVPAGRLHLAVRLVSDTDGRYTATLSGHRVGTATGRAAVLRCAPEALRTMLRIRRRGLALWLRGLLGRGPRVRPRPVHPRQEAVQ